MTLRLRLTLITSILIAIVLSGAGVAVYLLTERSLMVVVEERARQALSELFDGPLTQSVPRIPSDMYYQIVLTSAAGDLPRDVGVIRDGVIAGVPNVRRNPTTDSLLNLLSDRALEPLVQGGDVVSDVGLAGGQQLRVFGMLGLIQWPIVSGGALTGLIMVGVPITTMQMTLNQLSQDLAMAVLLAFLVFALAISFLSRRVLSPVQRVTQAAARISGEDLTKRVPVPRSRDEVRELAVTVNGMLARLQESFETQRRFTADASHELRTPVTSIRGLAEYLMRRTDPTPAQLEPLKGIDREAERMAKLVNDLLDLARADAGFTVQRQPMNIIEVLEEVKAELGPASTPAQIVLDRGSPLLEVEGDAKRLKQVVLNLVQNALNAGARTVTLHAVRAGKEVVLEVLDDGPGIPAEALPNIFERFFRVDGARRGSGSGLGLAIVRSIVQQHGGVVDVRSRVGEGTVFTVTLPALDPRATEPGVVRSTLEMALRRA